MTDFIAQTADEYLQEYFPQVSAMEFYQDLFSAEELDTKGEYTKGKYTGTAVEIEKGSDGIKPKRYNITKDLDAIKDIISRDNFCICSPVSYAGSSMKQDKSHALYSLTFDLDNLKWWDKEHCLGGIYDLFHYIETLKTIPRPTYIATTNDRNIHLYYLLDETIHLYPNILSSLRKYRANLIGKIWNTYISGSETQYEISPTQSFRMVGSIRKSGKGRVLAYKIGPRVSVDYLNSFVDEDCHIEKSRLTLDEAKKLYPKWYEAKFSTNSKKKEPWHFSRAVYDSFKQRIIDGENRSLDDSRGAIDGTRYFCISQLATTAIACGISYDELEKDAYGLLDILNSRTVRPNNDFTADDINAALTFYDDSYLKVRRETKENQTGLVLPPQKRNGRKQAQHLKYMRGIQKLKVDMGEINNYGRPNTRPLIEEYLKKHPKAKAKEISQALNISLKTVYKHLKEIEKQSKVEYVIIETD